MLIIMISAGIIYASITLFGGTILWLINPSSLYLERLPNSEDDDGFIQHSAAFFAPHPGEQTVEPTPENYIEDVTPVFNRFSKNCGHSSLWHPRFYHSFGRGHRSLGIVGGSEALKGEFPYHVRIELSENFASNKYFCGGSLLSASWVLTAAHCLFNFNDGYPLPVTRIVLGTNDLISDNTATYRTEAKRIVHENYQFRRFPYDFALLKLSGPVSFDTWKIRPICLPQSCADSCDVGQLTIATGFGSTSFKGNVSMKLKKVSVPVLSDASCQEAYSNIFRHPNDLDTSAETCAGNLTHGGADACQSDSGGPLACYRDGYFTLHGVTSWGESCGLPRKPGVYAKVCKHSVLQWIHENIDEDLQDDE